MKKEKKKSKKKKNVMLLKGCRIIWALSILFPIVLGYFIYEANILPLKYFLIIVGVFVVLLSIHGFFVLNKNTRTWLLVLLSVFAIFVMVGEGFAITKINDMINFLKENLKIQKTDVYYILANKNASFQSGGDIDSRTVYTVRDMEDIELFETKVKEKANVSISYEENMSSLLQRLEKDEDLIIIANSGDYDAKCKLYEEEQKDNKDAKSYEEIVKILETITIEVEIQAVDTGLNVTKDPFVVYLSGIDTRSNYLPSRSLSDVNIILAVNPNTKRILMIHIPRDYYVPVHGKNGLNDKLTHTGTIGGIELSMKTIEDLLEIQLPYYVRVNFNAVVNLVDAIGGININSDVNYSFSCWTDRGCTFHPGLNSVNGRCALAFARERHAYSSGDRHRGENQEQVLELVINKVTSSDSIIKNYNNILNALSGTFETNITPEEITNLIKMQIDDMSSWKMESMNVDGTGAMKPTYSYPNQKLYVMNPNMETVTKAISKLNEVLETP